MIRTPLLANITLLFILLTLAGCSTLSFGDKVTVQRQPNHLLFTKDRLYLRGPVKEVHYLRTRPGINGIPTTEEVLIQFNKYGQVTQVSGSQRALDFFGFLKYMDIPVNTKMEYGAQKQLISYETADITPRFEYIASVQEINPKTGNVKTFWTKNIKHKGTSAEKRYNTLDYFVYAPNGYMAIRRDNRKPEENQAHIYHYDQNQRLTFVYEHKDHYVLDKTPSLAIAQPKKYDFTEKKKFVYDNQGRISQVRQIQRNGQLTINDRWSYKINSNLPRRLTRVDANGVQQFKVSYENYQVDEMGNWTERDVKTTFRRGDKLGRDERKISYY